MRCGKVLVVSLCVWFVAGAVASLAQEVSTISVPYYIDSKVGSSTNGNPRDFEARVRGQECQVTANQEMAKPLNVGFVLDASGSMRGVYSREMLEGMVRFMRSLEPGTRFFAVLVNDNVVRVIEPLTTDPLRVLGGLPAQTRGLTRLLDSIAFAADASRELKTPPVFILISDGEDNSSRTKVSAVYDRLARYRATLYGFYWPSPGASYRPINPAVDLLPQVRRIKWIAEDTGGQLFPIRTGPSLRRDADRVVDLQDPLDRIAQDLRSRHELIVECTPKLPAGFHQVRLKWKGSQRARLRFLKRTYVAP